MRVASPDLTSSLIAILILTTCLSVQTPAQNNRTNGSKPKPASAPESSDGIDSNVSEMRAAIERYTVDRGSLQRSYPVATSPARRERFKKLYNEWLAALLKMDFRSEEHTSELQSHSDLVCP